MKKKRNKVNKLALSLMILLLVITMVVVLCACDNSGEQISKEEDKTPSIEPTLPIVPNVILSYPEYILRYDSELSSEVNFLFKPKYSGKYVFGCLTDSADLHISIDDKELTDGYVQYFDEGKNYTIKMTAQTGYIENYKALGKWMPIKLDGDKITIERYKSYIFKYTPDKASLYDVIADDCEIQVLNQQYGKSDSLSDNTYLLSSTELNKFYYIVVKNKSSEKIDIKLPVKEKEVQSIPVINDISESIRITGKAGEVQYYSVEVTESGKYALGFFGVSGNTAINSKIYVPYRFPHQQPDSLVFGPEGFWYEFTNLLIDKYYIKVEFKEAISAEMSFLKMFIGG